MYTLETLKEEMSKCTACDLHRTRTNVVFGEGPKQCDIMIIGEAPGEAEDLLGVPFIGPAGDKLSSILKYVGLERKDVFITNSILCHTPNNRNPNYKEMAACKWRLDLQIQLIKPKVIIALGKFAFEQLRGEIIKGPLNRYFGEWTDYKVGNDHIAKLMVTYHTSHILRNPEKSYAIVLPHWKKLKSWIEANNGT